jgi:hypothetical protein
LSSGPPHPPPFVSPPSTKPISWSVPIAQRQRHCALGLSCSPRHLSETVFKPSTSNPASFTPTRSRQYQGVALAAPAASSPPPTSCIPRPSSAHPRAAAPPIALGSSTPSSTSHPRFLVRRLHPPSIPARAHTRPNGLLVVQVRVRQQRRPEGGQGEVVCY